MGIRDSIGLNTPRNRLIAFCLIFSLTYDTNLASSGWWILTVSLFWNVDHSSVEWWNHNLVDCVVANHSMYSPLGD